VNIAEMHALFVQMQASVHSVNSGTAEALLRAFGAAGELDRVEVALALIYIMNVWSTEIGEMQQSENLTIRQTKREKCMRVDSFELRR
jgi:hypothetical protein